MSASNIHDDDALFQQAQKLISLITNIENVPKPKFGQAIRVCIQNLIEFCQVVLRHKKRLRDKNARKSISNSVLAIKNITPVFTQSLQDFQDDDNNSKTLIEKDNCIAKIIQAIRSINQTLQTQVKKKKDTSSIHSKKMDPLSELFGEEDTLYFEFDLTKINNSDSVFENADEEHDLNKCESPNYCDSNTCLPNSPPLDTIDDSFIVPRNITIDNYVDVIDSSSNLINTAHKMISRSHKLLLSCSRKDRATVKSLRQKLNQAIIEFDTSITNALKDMDSLVTKRKLIQDGRTLLQAIKNMKSFIQHPPVQADHSQPQCNIVQRIPPDVLPSSTDLPMSPTKTDNKKVHPVSINNFKEKVECILTAAFAHDLEELEKEINSLTEYDDGVKQIVGNIRKRSTNSVMIMDAAEKANRSTRQLIRHSRDIYFRQDPTKEEIESVHILSQDWCKCQVLLAEAIWHHLAPWTTFTSHFFTSPGGIDSTKQQSSTLSIWMNKFKKLEESICNLVTEFEQIDESCEPSLNSHFIKARNLCFEIHQHSSKVLQLAKLHLLGDVSANEWPTFGLWLFRWANAVQQLFYHIDVLTNQVPQTTTNMVSMKLIADNYIKFENIANQTVRSCQDSYLGQNVEVHMNQLKEIYEEMTTLHGSAPMPEMNNNTCNISTINAELAVLHRQWKLKAYALSNLVTNCTNYLSKPIDALLESARSERDLDGTNKNSFEEYKEVFAKKMKRIRIHTCLAVDTSTSRKEIHEVIETLDQLDDVSDQIVATCYRIVGNNLKMPISSKVNFLRLQWLSTANYLFFKLRKLPEVRYSAISAVMRHLHFENDVSNADEFSEVLSEHVPSSISLPDTTPSRLALPEQKVLTSEYDSVYNLWNEYSEESEDASDALLQSSELDSVAHQAEPRLSTGVDESQSEQTGVTPAVRSRNKSLHKKEKPPISPKPSRLEMTESLLNLSRSSNEDELTDRSANLSARFDEPTPKSIAAAAHILHREADKWEDENNSIIKVVKLMAKQMFQMAEFSKGRGNLKSKDDLVQTAKAIAANANAVAKFATVIADQSSDESCRRDLLHYAELVPTISTQLRIVASVKSVAKEDETADVMLVANAENLMKAVVGTLKAAEAASVKISNESSYSNDVAVGEITELAFQWKRKIRMKRAMNALAAPRGDLGLRLSKETTPLPSLTDLVIS